MKKVSLISLLLFLASSLFSQVWLANLPQGKTKAELTFFDYRNAFYSYWAPYKVDTGYYVENGVKKKAAGWKQFKRWEYDMERQINPATGEFPRRTAQEIYEAYLDSIPPSRSTLQANWTSLGPVSTGNGYVTIGRVNCISFHPTDNNTYWVGAASGGLWVTTTNGSSWTCLTDHNGVLAVSDVLIPTDFATSNTIYIATGDRDHWDNLSIGVLKSTNGGLTWNTTGITYSFGTGKMVYRLLSDPGNNQTLLASTSDGVFKSTNGGTTWNTKLTSTVFRDMEYKPGDANTLYGSTLDGKIYLSSNGGGTWTLVFSNASARWIDLSVSPNQPTWVYAVAAASTYGLSGIYKSTTSGTTFSLVFDGTTACHNLLGYDTCQTGGQAWYDLAFAVSPTDANTLFVGGIISWKSINGGNSWAVINSYNTHVDKHMLRYRTDGKLFECSDGGVNSSSDNGITWNNVSGGLVISQMYKLGVSGTVSGDVITGLQDNNTQLMSGGNWSTVTGGDGMDCIIDYSDVNVQYSSTQNGGVIYRTTDHWASLSTITPASAGTGGWVTPYILDPTNNQVLYAGYSDVWKTTNRGDTWTKISTMNTTNYLQSMAIAPSNPQCLFVADYNHIWTTTNGGTSWTNVTGTLPVSSSYITSIAVKNDDASTVWITLSGYNATKVYQSVNGGSTWTNISAGLPSIPAYSIVQNKQSTGEVQLYAGTELGVYFKKGSDNWIPYNTGLPNAKIGEIEIYYSGNPQESKLRAATFARGLWETPLYYLSTPMVYGSCTTTQTNTTSVNPNQANQVIIGVEVVTSGDLTPLSATSFTFNTIGTTNPSADISGAKLFYTGPERIFAPTTQVGSTVPNPNGSFTITGNQLLNNGTNFFWLTYDIPATVAMNDFLDAQCTSLTVGTSKTPTVTNPTGNRQVVLTYCNAGSTSSNAGYISRVRLGSIDQSSTYGAGGYEDYTAQATTVQIGSSYNISINRSAWFTRDSLLIWIDWNRDGDFGEAGENIYSSTASYSSYSTNFIPPPGSYIGTTRMRLRSLYNAYSPNPAPCGNSYYGEVEDYSIIVAPPCTPPSAQASVFTSSAITGTSMTAGWTHGTGTSVLVIARQGSPVNTDPVNGITYAANASFGSGTQIGTGNFVVYNGTGTSVNVTSLVSETTYYYAVYEYNSTYSCYLKPALAASAITGVCSYCACSGNMTFSTGITTVNFNTINNVTAKPAGYNDYTGLSTTVNKNSSYNLSVNVNTDGNYTIHALAWIDWNKDCDFSDAGETYDLGTATNVANGVTNLSPLSIVIPETARTGVTRIRVAAKFGSNPGLCETLFDGEVEDYSLNVLPPFIPATTTATGTVSGAMCYNATQSITVAGNGNTFTVQPGGSATMIAGQNIHFLPTVNVVSSGYLHGYIDPVNQSCLAPLIPENQSGEEDVAIPGKQASSLRVYPNPTKGSFVLEINDAITDDHIRIDLFRMDGKKIFSKVLIGEYRHEFSLSDQPAGVYFIRVISGGKVETAKIIRQ